MALINCPNCGKEISDKATTCIHCGKILKEDMQTTVYQTASNNSMVNDTPPPTYLWFSAIMILFNLIFGIIMCILSMQVKSKWAQGNVEGAKKLSKWVLILNLIFLITSIIVIIFALSFSL